MHTDAITIPTTSRPRYSEGGMKLFLDPNGENPPDEPGTPVTESTAWGRAMAASRKWDSAAALADYLASQFAFWSGRAPTVPERLAIARTASTIWADAVSERVVPTHPPEGIQFAVCAFSPCLRTFDSTNGFGVFCSKSCMIDEANTPGANVPGVPLVDEEEEAHRMNRAREVQSICAGFGLTPDGMPLPLGDDDDERVPA